MRLSGLFSAVCFFGFFFSSSFSPKIISNKDVKSQRQIQITTLDNATRANLGGLKHSERVFLGLALLHRYRNKREGTAFDHLFDLLDEKGQKEAEILGKAMRFGAMLMVSEDGDIGKLKWQPRKRHLCLELPSASEDLFGEVAESRLKSLADALRAELSVKIVK